MFRTNTPAKMFRGLLEIPLGLEKLVTAIDYVIHYAIDIKDWNRVIVHTPAPDLTEAASWPPPFPNVPTTKPVVASI